MNDACREWLEVLESGKYKKATGHKHGIRLASEEGACAFGVAVHHFQYDWDYLRYDGVRKKLGLPYDMISYVCQLNDHTELTLPEIAHKIREKLAL